MNFWRHAALMICASICLCLCGATTAEEIPLLKCMLQDGVEVRAQESKDGPALFLPAYADLTKLSFECEETLWLKAEEGEVWQRAGKQTDLTELFPEGPDETGVYMLYISNEENGEGTPVRILHADKTAALFIISDDPVNAGRTYLEAEHSKTRNFGMPAAMRMVNGDGGVVYDGRLRELKGRGNLSWEWSDKKPYRLKLEDKTDLLETGEYANRERTWSLVSLAFDASYAHDLLASVLGQRLGIFGTPETRHVDLWYDGEYRGLFLLSEKVQVKPGRVDLLEMETYMEKLYPQIENPALYPSVQAENERGLYQYSQHVDTAFAEKADYLLELDGSGAAKNACWFSIGANIEGLETPARQEAYALRSPQHASESDVLYLQGLIQDMVETVLAGGVHPQTGKRLEELMDIDSMARYQLVNQMLKNHDIGVTSTYFTVRGGKIYAGPAWDFDIACGTRINRTSIANSTEAGVTGYQPAIGWLHEILFVPVVQQAMKEIFENEFRQIVEEMNDNTLDEYYELLKASARMNEELWDYGGGYRSLNPDLIYPTFEGNWQVLRDYMEGRLVWMGEDLARWGGTEVERVDLDLTYINADVAASASVVNAHAYQKCTVSDVTFVLDREQGDEAWHALYTAEIHVEAGTGVQFAPEVQVLVNDCTAEVKELTENSFTAVFRFQAPFYEPAVYDGVDYGLVYQYDYFVSENPEIIEWYGDDRELALEEYALYYFPEGYSGIETFDFDSFYTNYERTMIHYFSSDTMSCMMYYLDNDLPELALGLEEPMRPKGEK